MLRTVTRWALAVPKHNTARSFSSSIPKLAKQTAKQNDAKKKLKRQQYVKNKNKEAPESHPLYMDVPLAMKFLRASEVGNPAKKTTVSILVTVIPERGSTPLNGSIYLPKPIKANKVLVFSSNPESIELARELGAAESGGLDLVEKIQNGAVKLDDFTHSFATPEFVKELKPIARNLGPKGLMPTPKKGTVSEDIKSLMNKSVGALPFKQKGQHLSLPIGRCDFSDKEIIENLKAASKAIYESQPPGTKRPNLIGQTCLSSTSGPSLVINFKNI